MITIDKIKTLFRLGLFNVARVGLYKYLLRFGRHPSQSLREDISEPPFFEVAEVKDEKLRLEARDDWQDGAITFFGKPLESQYELGGVPDWHSSPIESRNVSGELVQWWHIPDFDPEIGDIKCVWELSRFDWLLPMAQRAALGETLELERLDDWIRNWSEKNPSYYGRNWKCGQEASIRVLNLALTSLVLNRGASITPGLQQLLEIHLRRIAPTIGYAIGQSNNHGTSEAAALFVGGSWLGGADGEVWRESGYRWLVDRSSKLIETDGTFSQYSVNYHRLMLNTYSLCESWRRLAELPEFPAILYRRLSAATDWLEQMVDPTSGDAPNLGANDGANSYNLTKCGYRDFRPSLQWASVLFRGKKVFGCGVWDQQLKWLGLEMVIETANKPSSESLDKGGLQILRSENAVVYHRYPRYRFRPSQADALHCDFWVNGKNIFRDAGTFSYNVSEEDTNYFNGTRAHNTVEFDDRDQMPRYSRFLFGYWLKAINIKNVEINSEVVCGRAGYLDYLGGSHVRQLTLSSKQLVATDTVSGFKHKAVLRWRLLDGVWSLSGNVVSGINISISVTASVPIRRLELVTGYESRFYLHKQSLPVLEVEIDTPGILTTTVSY